MEHSLRDLAPLCHQFTLNAQCLEGLCTAGRGNELRLLDDTWRFWDLCTPGYWVEGTRRQIHLALAFVELGSRVAVDRVAKSAECLLQVVRVAEEVSVVLVRSDMHCLAEVLVEFCRQYWKQHCAEWASLVQSPFGLDRVSGCVLVDVNVLSSVCEPVDDEWR